MRTDDTSFDFGREDIAHAIDIHCDSENKSFNIRIQRADAVGEFKGKHRNDSVCDIDGCSSCDGFVVERMSGLDISGDISDVDSDFIS